MAQLTSTQDILDSFQLFVGDETELSSVEMLNLCQKIYNEILAAHDWEFLKKEATGTLSTSLQYIDLTTAHSDFGNFVANANGRKVVYVGTGYQEYPIVPFGERREYRNNSGFCWYDARQNRLYFSTTPTSADSYEFDYIYVPSALTTAGSNPVFPPRFYHIIYHGMCSDNDIIQMSEKARSYMAENRARYQELMNDMEIWNASITNMDTYGI